MNVKACFFEFIEGVKAKIVHEISLCVFNEEK